MENLLRVAKASKFTVGIAIVIKVSDNMFKGTVVQLDRILDFALRFGV